MKREREEEVRRKMIREGGRERRWVESRRKRSQ